MKKFKIIAPIALASTLGLGALIGSNTGFTTTSAAASEESVASSIQKSVMINPKDTAMLLVDHQSGLFQTVKDLDVPTLRGNVTALAKMTELADIPVITTASVPEGPNGPLIPEIANLKNAKFVQRTGEINAWDNKDFVKAVKDTGKKTLIIAGTWESVCMLLPSLSALEDGYKVYSVIDASGTYSDLSSKVTLARLTQAGAIPVDTVSLIAEVQKTWNRADAGKFASIYAERVPNYGLLMESYNKAYEEGEKSGK